jgi:micrococcal nuclease
MTDWIYPNTKILRVVDADTFDVLIDHGCDIYSKRRIRLAGVDAAESYGKNKTELGKEAKEFCKKLLEGTTVTLISKEKDGKYGRLIADIVINESNARLSGLLIDKGYAKYVKY